ncbi:MAG: amidohydrolase family protein [Actinobacteria bacterium]|nr:amidohydrolase family protein [Actinomycetota bacterium]
MVIDCHIHFDPEILTLDNMLACMDRHGVDKAALIATMVEPFYLDGKAKQAASGLLRYTLMRANPLGQVAYMTTIDSKGNFVLLGKKYRIYEKPDNAPVAEAVARHPDRFVGWIFVNPAAGGDPVEEVEKWSAQPGMVGVKAHPFWHRYPVSELDRVAAWCQAHGYPLLIHLGCRGGSGDYRSLPEKYPDLKVLYAHAGIPYFAKLWSYARDMKNVFIDLSSPYLDQELVRRAVEFLGAEKCLYGTDGPYGQQKPGEDYDYGMIKGWVERLPLRERDLERVLAENFLGIAKG